MTRSKSSVSKKERHKKILKLSKGYRGRARSCYAIAVRLVQRSFANSYRGRKENKRNYRRKFIAVINSFCRENDTRYSVFMHKFLLSPFVNHYDRKTMALMIQHNRSDFQVLFNKVVHEKVA